MRPSASGPNSRRSEVLQYITDHPNCSKQAISEHFNFGEWTATGYVDKLLYSEHIERTGSDGGTFRVPKNTKIFLTTRTGGDFSYVYAIKPTVAKHLRMRQR